MKRLLPLLLALFAAQFSGPAAAQRTNNPGEISGPQQERNWENENEKRNRELGVTLPAWPKDENLLEFYVSNTTNFRFFIDAASLSVGSDRIVRYTLIARSASGVSNVSYEGLRCDSGTYKLYAYGQDGRWSVQQSDWRDIVAKSAARSHHELRESYFCQGRTGTIFTAKEGLDALRRARGLGVTGRLPY